MLSEAENREVERYAQEFPEVKKELTAIEEALEIYAQTNAIAPIHPDVIEKNILERINTNKKETPTPDKQKSTPKTVPLVLGMLLLASLLAAVYWFYQQRQQKQLVDNQKERLEQLQTAYSELQQNCDQFSQQVAYLRDASNQSIQLGGTELSPNSSAIVHWNPTAQKSFLDFVDLPAPPSNKQYQLWAIVDGQPTDMGVFDLTNYEDLLTEVPFIENPQAFAVTLEDVGGSPTPNLDQLYIIGEVG